MDLTNTAVRWINLDSQPAKSGQNTPTLGGGKTVNRVFSDDLTAMHHRQKFADSGNNLPNEESQEGSIEVRLLTTDANSAPPNSHKAQKASGFQSSNNTANQADLISEISAFNKDSSTHDRVTSSESIAELTASLGGAHGRSTSPVNHSAETDSPTITATTSLMTATLDKPAAITGTTQQAVVSNAGALSPELSATLASSASQQGTSGTSSRSPKFNPIIQATQTEGSKVKIAVEVRPTQNSLTAPAITLNPAASTAPAVINPLKAEIQLVATQAMGKQGQQEGKSSKGAVTSGAGQEFKLHNAASKQVPVKLVMIEASATLQQWQKLKQIDSDITDSSAEPLSTLQSSEARSLRASPELQAARLVKTEQDAQALSQKFAEQLGQRLIQTVQKGHWRAELELHPKSLGRIDIQLDFVNGQLEGHFQTQNPHTRELLQEGLPRLREWLQQTGTQVANLEVNNGNSGQGGEKPTPQMLFGRDHDTATDEQVSELSSENTESRVSKEGFDLLV